MVVIRATIVFEHSSGPLAIKIGSMYTFSPFRLDISLEGLVIEWHGTSGHHETWTRSEVLDVESKALITDGAQSNAKRRNLGALLRKIMQTAPQSKHCDSGMPNADGS